MVAYTQRFYFSSRDTSHYPPLYLWLGIFLEGVELGFSVEAVAGAGRLPAGAPRALPRLRLRHALHPQQVQPTVRVVRSTRDIKSRFGD